MMEWRRWAGTRHRATCCPPDCLPALASASQLPYLLSLLAPLPALPAALPPSFPPNCFLSALLFPHVSSAWRTCSCDDCALPPSHPPAGLFEAAHLHSRTASTFHNLLCKRLWPANELRGDRRRHRYCGRQKNVQGEGGSLRMRGARLDATVVTVWSNWLSAERAGKGSTNDSRSTKRGLQTVGRRRAER